MIPMSISRGEKNERTLPADAKFGREMNINEPKDVIFHVFSIVFHGFYCFGILPSSYSFGRSVGKESCPLSSGLGWEKSNQLPFRIPFGDHSYTNHGYTWWRTTHGSFLWVSSPQL